MKLADITSMDIQQSLDSTTEMLGAPLLISEVNSDRSSGVAAARWSHGSVRIVAGRSNALQVVLNLSGGHLTRRRVGNRLESNVVSIGGVGVIPPLSHVEIDIVGKADVFQLFVPRHVVDSVADEACKRRQTLTNQDSVAIRKALVRTFVGMTRSDADVSLLLESSAFEIAEQYVTLPSWTGPMRRMLTAKAHRRVVDMVINRVEQPTGEPLLLDDLASAVALSKHHFIRAFKHDTGFTPHAFVLAKRLECAMALLRRTRTPVAEVARQSGFVSNAHFVSFFRQQTGATPGAFRTALAPT